MASRDFLQDLDVEELQFAQDFRQIPAAHEDIVRTKRDMQEFRAIASFEGGVVLFVMGGADSHNLHSAQSWRTKPAASA